MMIASSNGGAMSNSILRFKRSKGAERSLLNKEVLADFDPNCRFTRNLKRILSGRSDIELPALSLGDHEMRKLVEICMSSAMNDNGAVAAAVIISTMMEDLTDGTCLPSLALTDDIANLSWQHGMDRILAYAPWYVSDCFDVTPIHVGRLGLALTHSCLSMWLVREGCAWFIEEKGFPRICNRSQALMYLFSGNSCHNQIGQSWFARHPSRAKTRSWWFSRHPHLAFFCGAQTAASGVDLIASALPE